MSSTIILKLLFLQILINISTITNIITNIIIITNIKTITIIITNRFTNTIIIVNTNWNNINEFNIYCHYLFNFIVKMLDITFYKYNSSCNCKSNWISK